MALEATAEDRQAASLMGINTERMFALGWGIGSACVGLAGAFLASYFYIFPQVGFLFAIIAYVIVALGGFGSILGSLVEVLGGLFIAPAFKYVAVYLIYLLIVLVRPQGLLGKF
jgi:branched-chain amino acid transport system permease protein